MGKSVSTVIAICLFFGLFNSSASGRDIYECSEQKSYRVSISSADAPAYCSVNHRIGKMVLGVSNDGSFGTTYFQSAMDCFTGDVVLSCEYPKGSNTRYLYLGAFWIGAIVGRDTLVTVAATGWYTSGPSEFIPDVPGVVKRSISSEDPEQAKDAVSEEDYVMVYSDTRTEGVVEDDFGMPHVPLNIEVTQTSYAWSYAYAEDFILFDYKVRNVGAITLEKVYMGLYVDADVLFGQAHVEEQHNDDIAGFIEALPKDYLGCQFWDTVNIAWSADNDGDPFGGTFTDQSVPCVTGMRIIRTPADSLDVSFNWWISDAAPALDFGPREREGVGRLEEDFRDFGTGGLGTPVGDANSYYLMRNKEFDYDQIRTGTIGSADPLWLSPNPEVATNLSDGLDTRFLLSFGPFDVDPGEQLPISFAYVAGENFHQNPDNLNNLPDRPDVFYQNVSFSDLSTNAAWAAKVYDNPGYDTDGDGYAGKLRICCDDSLGTSLDNVEDLSTLEFYDPNSCEWAWYEGDGVPDFRGASPPPAPEFWLTPKLNALHVRINGERSETATDLFSGLADFEGYRIYIGRDDRATSYSVVCSYDREDYNKYVLTNAGYLLYDVPYSLDSLRCLYGLSCDDTLFHPRDYSQLSPLRHPHFADSIFYFEKQDFNSSEFGRQTPIRKMYPDQPYPSSLNRDSVATEELTEDGYLKYFEYELTIDNLLATVPYWVNVTAFDFGSPVADLAALETSVTVGAKSAYTGNSAADVEAGNLEAYVYPNPYRSDGDYRDRGYEGRTDTDRPDYRVRAINFANLPAKCTIRIYSLDGDLIRELDHDCEPGDPTDSHESWNMITKNTQMVVSGLYYWTVEAADGTVQIGKLVIVM